MTYYSFYFRPFTLIAPALMLGITAGVHFPGQRIFAFFGFTASVFRIVFRAFFYKNKADRKNPLFFLFLMSFCWGYFSVQSYTDPKFSSNHVVNFTDKYKWLIVGKVEDTPTKRNGKVKFVLQVETLGSSYTPVAGKIRVTLAENAPEKLSAGDRISFVSKIKSLRNYANPGAFDYKRYMALKDIWGTAFVHKAYPVDILPEGTTSEINKKIAVFRGQISQLIEKTGPGDHVGVLKALIIGDKLDISPFVRENFSRAGIAHILAISGLHITIIASFAYFIFRCPLRRFKICLHKAWLRKGAAILSFFPVMAYGLLAGMSYPTQRAIIIVVVFLLSLLSEKEPDAMNTLSLAAILTLILDPGSLFSISFQLSFSSTFAIIYGNSKIPYMKFFAEQRDFKVTKKLFSSFSVSLFAIVGTLPFIMLYYGQMTLVGFFANFIFIPVIGFFVLPMGLLSVFLYPISSELAWYCIRISAFGLSNTIEAVTPTYFEIFSFYVLIWIFVNKDFNNALTHDDGSQNFFIRKRFKILALIMLIASLGNVCYWLHERFRHEELRVTLIDVGQGTSALAELPGGHCFLIDGGGSPENSAFDVGENILAPFLLRKRIRTFDNIVLSHPDGDHLNGLLYVLRNFNVKNIWTTGDESDSPNYSEFMDIIREKQIAAPDFGEIFGTHDKINGVQIEVLYPPGDFMKKNETWRLEKNNNSMVLKFTLGETSFLFPGDIEAEAEKELVETAGDKLKSTVLIAPHHGSKTSSTEAFLDAVKPEYVIISAGWENRFHFPHPSVIKRYEKRNCQIFRTDLDGAIKMSTNGQTLEIETYRATVQKQRLKN